MWLTAIELREEGSVSLNKEEFLSLYFLLNFELSLAKETEEKSAAAKKVRNSDNVDFEMIFLVNTFEKN